MPKTRRRLRVAAMVAVALTLILAKIDSEAAYADGTPSAPSGLVAVTGNGSVTVSFTGSSSAGGSPILYYRVSVFVNGQDTELRADGAASPITVHGLTNGVTYTAKVKARNSSGFGTSSKPTPSLVPADDESSDPGTTTSTTSTTSATSSTTSDTSSTSSTTTSPPAARAPGDVLDLRLWRLNLPVDSKGGTSGESALVKQPKVLTYSDTSFALNPAGDGVVFTAGVGGATTENSRYARSELRELSPSGSLAAWKADSGTHRMTVTGSVDHLPVNKPQVSAAQIHGSSDLPLIVMATGYCDARCNHDSRTRTIPPGTVRLLTKENGDTSSGVLDPDYALGSRYTLTVEVRGGGATLTYTNLASHFASTRSFGVTSGQGLYFKAGAYTLSNLKSDAASDYGQTTISALSVTHTP
jgi:Alginate lyase/Fibronectin type III domain